MILFQLYEKVHLRWLSYRTQIILCAPNMQHVHSLSGQQKNNDSLHYSKKLTISLQKMASNDSSGDLILEPNYYRWFVDSTILQSNLLHLLYMVNCKAKMFTNWILIQLQIWEKLSWWIFSLLPRNNYNGCMQTFYNSVRKACVTIGEFPASDEIRVNFICNILRQQVRRFHLQSAPQWALYDGRRREKTFRGSTICGHVHLFPQIILYYVKACIYTYSGCRWERFHTPSRISINNA